MKLTFALLALSLFTLAARAQAPPEVQAMNSLPNAGELYLLYCGSGDHCVNLKAICYGQCCDQDVADEMGYGCFGDVEGRAPRGSHYAGWSCKDFDTGRTSRGKSTRDYDMRRYSDSGGCHNSRYEGEQ